jgi:hypothetical protein
MLNMHVFYCRHAEQCPYCIVDEEPTGARCREIPVHYLTAIPDAPSVSMHPREEAPAREFVCRLVRWGALLLLVTQFLFAHGCHGDEDHELFGIVSRTGR